MAEKAHAVVIGRGAAIAAVSVVLASILYSVWIGYQNDLLKDEVVRLEAAYTEEVGKKEGVARLLDRTTRACTAEVQKCRGELEDCRGTKQ